MTTDSEDDLFDAGDLSTDNEAEEQAAADYDEAASSGSNQSEILDATIDAAVTAARSCIRLCRLSVHPPLGVRALNG